MSGWLLDTNVLSEMRRPKPDKRVLAFVAEKPLAQLFVSIVTMAELRYGVEIVDDAVRRADLQHWLDHVIRPRFSASTLVLSESVLVRWRRLTEAGRKTRYLPSEPDVLIAATAVDHDLVVVSRDVKPFERMGIPIHNPWT